MTHKNRSHQTKQTENQSNKTQLDRKFDEIEKKEAKQKLRESILIKKQMRLLPNKKTMIEQVSKIKEMMKHPRIKANPHIMVLYKDALNYSPKAKIPTPLEIFSDLDHYRIEYYEYIGSILKGMRERNIELNMLNTALNNPYAMYLSTCLGCKLNPFEKSKDEEKPKEEIKKEEPINEEKPVDPRKFIILDDCMADKPKEEKIDDSHMINIVGGDKIMARSLYD
jgi:hypothetical protein